MTPYPTDRPLRLVIHAGRPEALADQISAAAPGADITLCDSYEGLPAVLADARPDVVYSVAFHGRAGFPAAALLGEGGPGWVAVGGVGVDHLSHWDRDRVTVTNSAGAAAEMMAQYVLAAFLHYTLDVPGVMADQAGRRWDWQRKVRTLAGQTVAIVGLGHTGRAVARLAKAVGMTVIGTRARPRPTDNVDEVGGADDLLAFLARADAVAVCTPLIDQTRGLIGPEAVAAMKPGCVFADVSRGGVTDHAALGDGLASGRIRGAWLDVFPTEPLPEDSPVWGLPNTVISPHSSAVFAGWGQASVRIFTDNLARWRAGQPLQNVVDPARGY